MKDLLEEEIREVRIDPEGTYIAFLIGAWPTRDDNWRVYEAQGDCCSSHWIEAVLSPEVLIDETVQGVRLYEPVEAPPTRQDSDQLYKLDLITKKGVCTILHRNSSNGYYGGELALRDPRDRRHCTVPLITSWPLPNPTQN